MQACATELFALRIRLREGIAEVHYAARITAVPQTQRVAQLMNDFFRNTSAEEVYGCPDAQPMQGHKGNFFTDIGHTENEVEIAGVAVCVRHGQDRTLRARSSSLDQHFRSQLAALGVIGVARTQDRPHELCSNLFRLKHFDDGFEIIQIDRLYGKNRERADR
jgi:hypothetical protein